MGKSVSKNHHLTYKKLIHLAFLRQVRKREQGGCQDIRGEESRG